MSVHYALWVDSQWSLLAGLELLVAQLASRILSHCEELGCLNLSSPHRIILSDNFLIHVPVFQVWFFCKGATLISCTISVSVRLREDRLWYHFAFSLFNVSFSVTRSGTLGCRRLVAVSKNVLVRRDINLCAGLVPSDSVRVTLWPSRATHKSSLSSSVFLI